MTYLAQIEVACRRYLRPPAGPVTPKSRIELENPLGHDRASAEAINHSVGALSFKEKPVDACERRVMDAVKGKLTLFMRRDGFAWNDES